MLQSKEYLACNDISKICLQMKNDPLFRLLLFYAVVTFFLLLPCSQKAGAQSLLKRAKEDIVVDEWRSGISILDLLFISQHITQIERLPSPYAIIAADVNYSGTVTMVDISCLRQLLLGKPSDCLDEGEPWRYIRADYHFPDSNNPFQGIFPEFPKGAGTPINFIAVKIGDVNNSHTDDGGYAMARVATLPIGIGKASHRSGEFVTIPVTYDGTESLAALQLGLQFDAGDWELLEPSTADLPDFEPGCFNLREAGEGRIKFLWFTPWPKEQLQQGRTLFYLTFRRKSAAADAVPDLHTNDAILENAGFTGKGIAYGLVSKPSSVRSGPAAMPAFNWSAECVPNPVTDLATLRIQSPAPQAMSVWVFNALGVRTYYKELKVPAGATEVAIPEVSRWPAGIYTWKVKSGKDKLQGQFIRR